jgi:hypothetical protein
MDPEYAMVKHDHGHLYSRDRAAVTELVDPDTLDSFVNGFAFPVGRAATEAATHLDDKHQVHTRRPDVFANAIVGYYPWQQ